MCTVVVGFDPQAHTPLVVAALRDEVRSRPWDRPSQHWPDRPDLVGGRDRLAGGTWLAVDAARSRTAALLNGWPWDGSMPWEGPYPASRGDLPLQALAHQGRNPLQGHDLTRYAPFHLIDADPYRAVLHSWDGRCLDTRPLPSGVSTVVNTGLDPADPRSARHTPEFAASRPDPEDLAGLREPESIWGAWPGLVTRAAHELTRSAGTDDSGDPSALIAHADLGEGQVWATGSVTLVAADRETVRYAFTSEPADPAAWEMIEVQRHTEHR